jgi:hypothetical protein
VAAQVLQNPRLFSSLFQGLQSGDPLVRVRAADAIEKVTLRRPGLLRSRKKKLLGIAATAEEKELRWHMALLLPRLPVTASERQAAVDILFDYLRDASSIVRTFAMQGLADFSRHDGALKARVLPLIEELTQSGTPAMRARGRKLLKGILHAGAGAGKRTRS